MRQQDHHNLAASGFRDAVRFWEPRRVCYNALLTLSALLWLVLTWPHFRPALTWLSFGKMMVLALLANLCYCAGYVAEFFIQGVLPVTLWRWVRYALFVIGMLIALVLANYWIADEIYPDFAEAAGTVIGGSQTMGGVAVASNMNFPAPLSVLGFLGACFGFCLAIAAALIFWFARKPNFARTAAIALGIGAAVYLALLIAFSATSHDTALNRGQEKYFCEIDCHLAYAVIKVNTVPEGDANDYTITLRTRFDETTTSPERPKDASLTPAPREVRVIDSYGRTYAPASTSGTSLMRPLKPAESYTTQFEFRIPKDATGLRFLVNTIPAWPDHVLIGDENSWLHKKTYFAL
jgi:hypothetical protein